MSKWLLYDLDKLKYVDAGGANYARDTSVVNGIIDVLVSSDSPLVSGIGLDPDQFPIKIKENGEVYSIYLINNNLTISGEGGITQSGFLPYSGGNMNGFITLHNHPINEYHASTKQYVDNAIEYSSISGSVADAISSLIQVDLTLGTDLLVTNQGLPLSEVTAVINGDDFVLGANSITMKDPGMYQVSWNVVSFQGGTSAIRRRNLVCDLNLNSGASYPTGSLGGTYSRSSVTSPYMNVGGDYIITTTIPNETVSIRSRDLSTESNNRVIYSTAGGYMRIRLVRKL